MSWVWMSGVAGIVLLLCFLVGLRVALARVDLVTEKEGSGKGPYRKQMFIVAVRRIGLRDLVRMQSGAVWAVGSLMAVAIVCAFSLGGSFEDWRRSSYDDVPVAAVAAPIVVKYDLVLRRPIGLDDLRLAYRVYSQVTDEPEADEDFRQIALRANPGNLLDELNRAETELWYRYRGDYAEREADCGGSGYLDSAYAWPAQRDEENFIRVALVSAANAGRSSQVEDALTARLGNPASWGHSTCRGLRAHRVQLMILSRMWPVRDDTMRLVMDVAGAEVPDTVDQAIVRGWSQAVLERWQDRDPEGFRRQMLRVAR